MKNLEFVFEIQEILNGLNNNVRLTNFTELNLIWKAKQT